MKTIVKILLSRLCNFKVELKKSDKRCALTADISFIMHSTSTTKPHTLKLPEPTSIQEYKKKNIYIYIWVLFYPTTVGSYFLSARLTYKIQQNFGTQ